MSITGTSEVAAFEHAGRSIGYVIRHGRCRRMRLCVPGPGEVEVRVPLRVSPKAVHAFVAQHAEWILRAMARQTKKPHFLPRDYVTGETLYVLGKPFQLEVSRSVWKSVTCEADVLRVSLYNTAAKARVKELVEDWLLKQARHLLAKILGDMIDRFGGHIRHAQCPVAMRSDEHPDGIRLTVRTMKTRWGSCSKDGHITLGLELAHVPLRLVEYVIVHELCHLEQLNHSRAFYFLLATCLPDWKERRHELKTHSWLQRQVQT